AGVTLVVPNVPDSCACAASDHVAATPNTSMRVARAATSTIPIVFVSGGDPIETGLVTNLSRPGGNIGVSFASTPLQPKRLGLLHENGHGAPPKRSHRASSLEQTSNTSRARCTNLHARVPKRS